MFSTTRALILKMISRVFLGGRSGCDNADTALRYLPISDLILEREIRNPSILEVGSGVKGITPYLKDHITGADVSFDGEIPASMTAVEITGTSLPFEDNTFDYVISVDMLEHVPSSERSKIIEEILRVARAKVFLAVPCGRLSQEHDRELDDFYQSIKGSRYHFFKDHVENGLAEKQEIEMILKGTAQAMGLSVQLTIQKNVNLLVRSFFMKLWIRSKTGKTYNWISPFICILRRFINFGDCYRCIYVVDINPKGSPQ